MKSACGRAHKLPPAAWRPCHTSISRKRCAHAWQPATANRMTNGTRRYVSGATGSAMTNSILRACAAALPGMRPFIGQPCRYVCKGALRPGHATDQPGAAIKHPVRAGPAGACIRVCGASKRPSPMTYVLRQACSQLMHKQALTPKHPWPHPSRTCLRLLPALRAASAHAGSPMSPSCPYSGAHKQYGYTYTSVSRVPLQQGPRGGNLHGDTNGA